MWLENFLVQLGRYPEAKALAEVAPRVRKEVDNWESFVIQMDLDWGEFMVKQERERERERVSLW
jgi:hypothetical protein